VELGAASATEVEVAAGSAVAVESAGRMVPEEDEAEEEEEEDDEEDDDEEEEEEEETVLVDDADDVPVELLELPVLVGSVVEPVAVPVVCVNVKETLTVGRSAVLPLAMFATVAARLLAVPHPHWEKPPSNMFL
jgi:hypothetical protein